ncbi:hypothetical protein ABZU94_10485 [Streptomyces mirabilis]|uniref:hypothetical protein n=1 Tax=Streptomyces sp. NPDC005388 TaxID=3156717 RepID=UPI0033A5BA7B
MLTACLILIGAPIGYALLCLAQPFRRCRRCSGTGKTDRRGATVVCPRCRGERWQLRRGRRLHNAWRRTHEAGTRPSRFDS